MSRPINPDLTGPGNCKNCSKFVSDRPAKGLCRRCYDQQRTADPLARAGLQQKAIDRGPLRLVQMQAESKKLRDDQTLSALQYVTIYRVCEEALESLQDIIASDIRQQEDDAMNELEVESQNIQPQPDQGGLDLQNIPDNPNPVEVDELPRQPQPVTKAEDDEPNVA